MTKLETEYTAYFYVFALGIADMINHNQFITLPYIQVKVILKSRVAERIAVESPQASEVD